MNGPRYATNHPSSNLAPDSPLTRVLDGHPGVAAYAVENGRADHPTRVLIVPTDDGWLSTPGDLLVESWRIVFESTYEQALENSDPDRAAIAGWHDSFTDRQIAEAQMNEWAAATVSRIVNLHPRRIVEIGAGSGMILAGVLARLPKLQSYLATDISTPALELLTATARRAGGSDRVAVQEAEALEAACIDVDRDFTVVNSMVQYLPSTVYLDRLIREIVARTPDGGHVLLGDIRHADLLPEFASLKVASRTPGLTDQDALSLVRTEMASEGELCVSPRFFTSIPQRHNRVTAVEVAPRRGSASNEMTIFRFDVVLHVGCAEVCPKAVESRWAVANARLLEAAQLSRRWGVRPTDNWTLARDAVDPEQTWVQAERTGRLARISWARSHPFGGLDVEWGNGGASDSHFNLARPITAASTPPSSTGPLLAPLVEHHRVAELNAAVGQVSDRPTFRFVLSLNEAPDKKEQP